MIDQQISPIPTPPSRSDPTNFNQRADDFLAHLPTLQQEMNTFGDQANALADEMNAMAQNASNSENIAMAAANFKGEWDANTTYVHPSSVVKNGTYYLTLQDSTGQDPESTTGYWSVYDFSGSIVSVADRSELRSKKGSIGDIVLQRDIALYYEWVEPQLTDDNVAVINVTDDTTGSWKALYLGAVNTKWGGVDSSNSNTELGGVIANYNYLDLNGDNLVYDDIPTTDILIKNGAVKRTDGTVNYRFVQKFLTTKLVTHLNSYLGFVNDDYTGDDATRIYIMPRSKITSGAGGALKIFADAYHTGADYRDFGIYFYADQNGDTGYNGTGVFWLNSKAQGASFNDKTPDIGFSFQDGLITAGKFVRINDANGDRAVFIVGKSMPTMATATAAIGMEVSRDIGIENGYGFRAEGSTGALDCLIRHSSDGSSWSVIQDGVESLNIAKRSVGITGRIYTSVTGMTDNAATIDVSDKSFIVLGNSAATTVTDFINPVAGQELTIIFANSNTTIQNGTNIKLAGAVNFTGSQDDTLTLVYSGSAWYEKCRSIN